jgi:hypothetical protein
VHTLAAQSVSGRKSGKSSWSPSRTRYVGKSLPKDKSGLTKVVPEWALREGNEYVYDSGSESETESETEYRPSDIV